MTRRAFDIIFYRGSKCFPLKAGPALGLGHLGYGLWPPNIERSPLIWGGKSTHSRCGKCAKCQIFVTFATPNTKTPPIKCSICAKFLPFVSAPLQICNGTDTNGKLKNTILFGFSLSSHFFIWFSLSLLRICLSLPSSQPVFFLFSQSDTSKKKVVQKKAAVVANHRHPP